MPNTVLTHTVIEDKAQTVINDYVRTKDILTEKMNAHDEVIAKILNDHEQSVTDFTDKIDAHTKKLNIHGKAIEDALIKIDAWKELHDGAYKYLMVENKDREKDIIKVKENLQASYDHLNDKIEHLRLKLNAAIISLLIISTVPFFIISFTGNKSENKDDNTIITTEVSDTATGYEFGIAQIGATGQPEIIYDKDTKVMYLVSENGNHTVILNSDGSPKLYNAEE